jgi:MoaA/NifB/PqqE/SkfB family radical SAM enzyme
MGYEARHWVRLTAACNNYCIFCLDAAARMGEILPMKGIMEDLQRGRDAGITRVVLSGGEPTIHTHYIEIIEKTRAMGYTHIQTVSNGRLFAKQEFLDKCLAAGLDEITISVHGHTAELHDKLVGVEGAFKETIVGLANALKKPNLIVSCDVVLNKLNMEVIDDMMWYLVRMGVREFDLLHVIPFSAAWDNWETLNYDPDTTVEKFHRALTIAQNMGVTIWTNR